jgi:hypothetical protein
MKKQLLLLATILISTVGWSQISGTGTLVENLPNQGIQNKQAAVNGNNLTSVLVLGSPGNPLWIDDVESKLDNTGLVDADTFLSNSGTPTVAELMAYDAVFLFTDAGAADPVALGDNLATYIESGGAVVDATFTPNVPITGGFTAYELYSAAGQSNGANLGIGAILEPGHPTLNGVTSFDGGTASFHNTAGAIAAGASVVAEYTTGDPLIIVAENVGPALSRRAFLNFYPPSFDARDDFWAITSDGDLIMANALVWAANISDLPNVLIAGSPGNPDWLLDVEAQLEGTGNFSGVDTFLTSGGTPTLVELQSYDAVYLFTDAGAVDPVAFGNVLEQYIDGGGAVLDATFTPNVTITGGFTQYELYSTSGQSNGTNLGIGTIVVPNHPTLDGVNTFDGGTASFHNTGGTLAAGAIVVAEYTDGSPLIIVAENVGPSNVRRAFLNFYPPSIDARDDFWDTSSDGAVLMASTIYWLLDFSSNSAPQALCQDFNAVLDGSGSITITAANVDNGSSDSDGTITLSIDNATFTCADLGANTVILTVTDDDGATSTCSATVTVVDLNNPEINCPADETVTYLEGESYVVPDYVTGGDVTGVDNCGFTITQTPPAGATLTEGTFTIIFTITDTSGNTANCDFELTVDKILGLEDIATANFKLYPNPTTSQITIEGNFEVGSVEVFNLLGQRVMTSTSEILNVGSLVPAIYLVTITDTEGNKATKRFIKK